MAQVTIERNDSYQFHITPEGESVVRTFYAIWADVYGSTNVLPEIGERIPVAIAPDRPDLVVVDIQGTPTMEDLTGCNIEITYSNIYPELGRRHLPDNRRSWVERFYTQQEYKDVINQYDSSAKKYSGTALTDTDAEGQIITTDVLARVDWVYELNLSTSRVNMADITARLRSVNSVPFFNIHRAVQSTDPQIKDKEGEYDFASNDTQEWRFDAAQVTRNGKESYDTTLIFTHNADKWNTTTETFYPEADLTVLVDAAKQGFPPPNKYTART